MAMGFGLDPLCAFGHTGFVGVYEMKALISSSLWHLFLGKTVSPNVHEGCRIGYPRAHWSS